MDDTISRQEAIKAIEAYFGDLPIKGHYDMLQLIKQLPSAQPDLSGYSDKLWKAAYERGKAETEPRWIPVTERLPKPYEYCLWTTTDGRVIYHHCDGLFSNYIAWMPLPKPYERSEDE